MADIACTSAMCAQGRVSVQQMRTTFDSLASSNSNFNRSYYEPTVISIEQAFHDNYSVFSEWVPFNPTCCAVQNIGQQADSLTHDMLQSVGAETPPVAGPSSGKPPIDINGLITLGALALGAILIANISQATRR
jgi:hypothetical protein